MKLIHFIAFTFLLISSAFEAKAQNLGNKNQEVTIVIDKKDASGENKNDASLKVKVSGGTAPYTISCFSPYELPKHTKASELNLKNLKPGDYLFVVQDGTGKTNSKEITITVEK